MIAERSARKVATQSYGACPPRSQIRPHNGSDRHVQALATTLHAILRIFFHSYTFLLQFEPHWHNRPIRAHLDKHKSSLIPCSPHSCYESLTTDSRVKPSSQIPLEQWRWPFDHRQWPRGLSLGLLTHARTRAPNIATLATVAFSASKLLPLLKISKNRS